MYSENGLHVDLRAIEERLRAADVVVFGFALFPERLLIDVRANDDEGPLVALVAPVATVQERYAWLGAHRGRFGLPRDFAFAPWPHSIASFRDLDVLRPLRERLEILSPDAPRILDDAIDRLARLERDATVRLIKGEAEWGTLWQALPAGRH